MHNQTLSFIILLITSFTLVLTAGYLSHIQSWATLTQSTNKTELKQKVTGHEIRAISSGSNMPLPSEVSAVDSIQVGAQYLVKHPTRFISVKEPSLPASSELIQTHTDTLQAVELKPLPIKHPVFIEYSDELLIEFPSSFSSKQAVKRAISRVLLTSAKISQDDLVSLKPMNTHKKPLYYFKVKNQYGQPIRYPAAANQYADYLLANHSEEMDDGSSKFLVVHIPLHEHKLPYYVEKYQGWVGDYADRYDVSKDLIFAIMEVESGFNDRAVSQSNALGLMQLKAASAGRDVYELIEGKNGQPNRAELFDAKTNIRMGTAYLSLLQYEYLDGIRNNKNKEMLVISAYNGGITKTLKLFGETLEKAIIRVNQLHPKQIYRILRYKHQSNEARLYLDKVLKAKSRYSDLLGLDL